MEETKDNTDIIEIDNSTDGKKMISGGTKKNTKIRICEIGDFKRKCKKFDFSDESQSPSLKQNLKDQPERMKFVHSCETLENKHTKAINSLAVSPDGERLVSGGADRKIIVWNLTNGYCIAEFKEEKEINILKYFPNGSYLLAGTAEAVIKAYGPYNYKQNKNKLMDLATK